MNVANFLENKKIITEHLIIQWFRDNALLGYRDVDIRDNLDAISDAMSVIIGAEMNGATFDTQLMRQQIRIANVCFRKIALKLCGGTIYYRNGYFIHLENNILHCLWKSVGDVMAGLEMKRDGAFNELRKFVAEKGFTILIIENATDGTLKMLQNHQIPMYGDKDMQTPTDGKFGSVYVNVYDMLAPSLKQAKMNCNVCDGKPVGTCNGRYYCSVQCQTIDFLNGHC